MSCFQGERLTFMVPEVTEETKMDGTRTVNGPDVVRISWQPCSVGGERGLSEYKGGAPEWMVLDV